VGKKEELSAPDAILEACCDFDIAHFPRTRGSNSSLIPSEAVVADILRVLQRVQIAPSKPASGAASESGVDAVLARAADSLKEVKALTEYQDQKATRLVTVVAFLSALAGALFSAYAKDHPLASYLWGTTPNLAAALVVSVYGAFAAFVIFAATGALVVFHATQTTFKWPSEQNQPTSRLFYRGILSATPEAWAKSFVSETDPSAFKSGDQIKLEYSKDYILETYLVAAKVADKIRFLQPAQSLLKLALRALYAWALLMIAAAVIHH
jgi:hypothetical protein